MDPLSAGASVLTFLGLAFAVTKAIHDGLTTIKDGPQVIRDLSNEFAQLRNILERLSRIPMSIADATEVDGLAKKWNEDVAGFEARLRRLDASGADGRKRRAWRKLKFYFTEKDLEQMRHVVRGHIQLLTVRLNILQVQQGCFSAAQSTEILNLLQKLREDVATLHRVNPVHAAGEDSTHRRVVELDKTNEMPDVGSNLDCNITRLMGLLGKKPCVIASDDAQELVGDLEHLIQSIQRDAATRTVLEKTFCEVSARRSRNDDVTRELKVLMGLISSAPSMKINQRGNTPCLRTKPCSPLTMRRLSRLSSGSTTKNSDPPGAETENN